MASQPGKLRKGTMATPDHADKPSPKSENENFDRKLDRALIEAERLSRDLSRLAKEEANAHLAAIVLKREE
jgi:hypothetical protein